MGWHALGWTPAFFSEIDPFPCAMLAHYYPHVPNYGDMTRFKEWPDAAIDALVGGTPCQAFSVAGLRQGLADPRGNLTLTYLAIAERYRPEWLVWENVPGVLSDRTGAFGALLGGLAKLGYGWAYRVLDAQYFGLAQRRKRVFVVGSARGWACAAAVLFERASLQGNPAPRRETGEGLAASLTSGSHPGSNAPGRRREDDYNIVNAPTERPDRGGGNSEGQRLVTHALRAEGFDASEDGTGRGIPLTVGTLAASSGNAFLGTTAQDAGSGYLIPVAPPPIALPQRRRDGQAGLRNRDASGDE